jgi:hypothetical protein
MELMTGGMLGSDKLLHEGLSLIPPKSGSSAAHRYPTDLPLVGLVSPNPKATTYDRSGHQEA